MCRQVKDDYSLAPACSTPLDREFSSFLLISGIVPLGSSDGAPLHTQLKSKAKAGTEEVAI